MAFYFLKYVIRKAELVLVYRPSQLAAACLLLSINVSLSEKLSILLKIECLNNKIFVNEPGALAWWTKEVDEDSMITQ